MSDLYIIFPFIAIDFASAVEKKLNRHAYYSVTSLNRKNSFPKLIRSLSYVPFARGQTHQVSPSIISLKTKGKPSII